MIDLDSLAYPRHLHKGNASQIVQHAGAAKQALAEGWTLLPAGAEYDVPGAVELPKPAKDAKK